MDIEEFKKPSFFKKRTTSHFRISDLLMLSVRGFKVRTTRTLLTILGFSVGIGMVLFLVALGYGLQFILIGNLASTEDSLVSLEVFYPSESNLNITTETLDEMLKLPGVDETSSIGDFPTEIQIGELTGFLTASIIDENYFRLSGTEPDIGTTFSENQNGVILSSNALQLFAFENNDQLLGKEVTFSIFYPEHVEPGQESLEQKTTAEMTLPIIGIINDEFSPPFIFVPSSKMVEKPPFYQHIFIKALDVESVEPVRDTLIEQGFITSAKIDLITQARKIMTAVTVILGVFGATALIVSAIGMLNTMTISFLERIYEVGIMKSLGASSSNIRSIFLTEAFLMGLLGGIGGILLGFSVGGIFNFGLNLLASQLGGESVKLFIYPIKFLLTILGISIFVGLFSGFWPARRAAKLTPKEAFERR